jgi:hypothetical protein
MERFKNIQALAKHQRRKSDQSLTKETSFSGTSRNNGSISNSSIGRGLVLKHYPKSGNNSINLDLSKVHVVQVPCTKNNSARHLEHRRANTFYLQRSKERLADSRTGREKKENLNIFKENKLTPAPEVGITGITRFVEKMVLAEQKMSYFYKKSNY